MKREEYIEKVLQIYALVTVLSEKNGCYVKLPFDSIVLYGLCKKLSVMQINELLYEYGLETLG